MNASVRRISRFFWFAILFFSASVCSGPIPAALAASQPEHVLAVLANPADPYYPLAKEIAATEKAPFFHTLPEILDYPPVFLLWVVSPGFLSDAAMVEFGITMRNSRLAISTGIITASTLDGARALWQRRSQVESSEVFAANAANPSAQIFTGQLFTFTQDPPTQTLLTKSNFKNALAAADYLTFTGHGGSWFLGLDANTLIKTADIPPLGPALISTGSCQTVRPWAEDSIAIGFIDAGAAAYSGFVYSPNEGYLIGEFDGLPFRYTWPDFPIGHVLQAQSRGTLQGFALFPFLYLLGDPRIALQTSPPYAVLDDQKEGPWRSITYAQLPAGIVPIHIPGGAAYDFVQAVGLAAAAQGDPFYNSRLQWVDIHADKFILLAQPGGELTLRLRQNPPWYWFISDILFDSLDHTLIYLQGNAGDYFAAGFALFPLAWTGWQVVKRRLRWREICAALIFGACMAGLQLIYALLRLDHITITSKPVAFSALSILTAFVLAFCAALIFFQARTFWGRLAGLFVIAFPGWAAAVFSLLLIGLYNILGFTPKLGAPLYNYALGLLPLATVALYFLLAGSVLCAVAARTDFTQRRAASQHRNHENSL